jgi:C_GCAxxG_C_C family probable redox protein
MDRDAALRLASSFGGGMGRLREVCGAVTGMFMVAGMLYGYTDAQDDEIKAAHYALIQSLAHTFREKHGSYVCRELLGLPEGESDPVPSKRTAAYYAARPCGELAYSAAELLDNLIAKRKEE